MAQVQVFTNGKWVGAGSQTVDPSNCINLLLNPIFFYRPSGPAFQFQVGYTQKYTNPVGLMRTMAPEDLTALTIGGSGGSPVPVYPMMGGISSFPDGTKVICYGYYQAETSGSALADSQNVFMIGIPLDDVNTDTKMEMVWYPQDYGQITDYVSGAIDGALRYKFDMVRMIAPVGGPSNPSASTIAFYAVTWGMIRSALKLKPTAVAANFLGYDGNWQSHTVQFRKTILA